MKSEVLQMNIMNSNESYFIVTEHSLLKELLLIHNLYIIFRE